MAQLTSSRFPLSSALLALWVMLMSGCGSLVGTGPTGDTPGPPPPSLGEPSILGPPEVGNLPTILPVEPEGVYWDAILDSPWARAPEMQEEVERWIESFQGREAEQFRGALIRMGPYREMVEGELRARNLPGSLAFLPIVESWYSQRAVSWVGAAGLWQFMPPTARGLGLRVDRITDERRDPFRATPLALDFLSQLRGQFGSWFLALAAYNSGPGRVQRILRRHASGEPGHDGLFLSVRSELPRETRNFVPRFLAAATVAMDPARYGFQDLPGSGPLRFDEVEVSHATSLDVVARAAGVEQSEVEALNPQLLRGFTPAGVRTWIRLPAGTGDTFLRAYALIPPEDRLSFVEHQVASGETLTHIARYYGVSVSDLRGANPRVEPRRMQIGQRIVVPRAPSGSSGVAGSAEVEEGRLFVYRVRPGDTLSAIAVRHRVRVSDLIRWNELSRSSIIRPGDEVKIYPSGGR